MTIRKEEILDILRDLPDDIDIEELIHELYLLEKIARSEAGIASGQTMSSEEVRAEVESWRG